MMAFSLPSPDNATIVRELLALGYNTDVNLTGLHEYTPLHFVAEWGRTAAMQPLLEHPDIRVNEQDNDDCSPLHVALQAFLSEEYGVDEERPPATVMQTLGKMKLLLSCPDTKINECNKTGNTVLDCVYLFLMHNNPKSESSKEELQLLLEIELLLLTHGAQARSVKME